VFVTSKVAVTFGLVNVRVLAQLPFDERVPVSEYVADVADVADVAWEVSEIRRKGPTTATRVSRVARIFMMFISPTGCFAVSRTRPTCFLEFNIALSEDIYSHESAARETTLGEKDFHMLLMASTLTRLRAT
jgi:hypothetical protein